MATNHHKNQLRRVVLLIAACIALYLCWLLLFPFIEVLAWAGVLVILFHPLHRRLAVLMRNLRGGATWSALLSTLLVISMVLIPLLIITLAVIQELSGMTQNLSTFVASLLDPASPVIGRFLRWLNQYIDISQIQPQEYLLERLKTLSDAIASRTLGIVGGLAGAIVDIFFIIFTMYYLFRDSERIKRLLADILPLERPQAQLIFARTQEVINASIHGLLLIALLQGFLGGLAFWVLGLPSPLVWGVAMFFLSMIPLAGSFVVWIPAVIFLAATGQWWKAGILMVWGTGVIGLVDNFLRPKVVGEKAQLHELMIFFSVLGGLQLFGILGLVLGPVIVAITIALLDTVRQMDHPFELKLSTAPNDERQSDLRKVS
jgi:predicted PurR-regulated permease PerM